MKTQKRNYEKFWLILVIVLFLIANFFALFVTNNRIERSSSLFFAIYLIIYWFLPFIGLIAISEFKKKYCVVKKEKLDSLASEISQNPESISYLSNTYKGVFFEYDKDQRTELDGVYYRIIAIYYTGVLLTNILFTYS